MLINQKFIIIMIKIIVLGLIFGFYRVLFKAIPIFLFLIKAVFYPNFLYFVFGRLFAIRFAMN